MPARATVERMNHLVVLVPKSGRSTPWPQFPHSDTLRERHRRLQGEGDDDAPLVTDLPNAAGTRTTLACVTADASMYEYLTLARKLTRTLALPTCREINIVLAGLNETAARAMAEALVLALLAAATPMPSLKSRRKAAPPLRSLRLFGVKHDFRRIQAVAEGNGLARYLTHLPGNHLTPGQYRRRVAALARAEGWAMTVYDTRKLKRLKAGAFLAVAQGSDDDDACIIRLRYRPARAGSKPPLALVGKGICFDTGGNNLKPAKSMHGMHEDMAGSAVALGTLLALTRLKADYSVDCWLALAQNHIGPNAYKQNDVIRACNGTTIEIVHTDAEGRMVLADTLALAARQKPRLIIDFATLTGSCVEALGTRYSGAFSNRERFNPLLIEAGVLSGERVWPFPMSNDFDNELDSGIADIKQCLLTGEADHILGARFLNRFVDDIPWVHVDLSACNNKGGLAAIATDITGFGVGFTLELLGRPGILE